MADQELRLVVVAAPLILLDTKFLNNILTDKSPTLRILEACAAAPSYLLRYVEAGRLNHVQHFLAHKLQLVVVAEPYGLGEEGV